MKAKKISAGILAAMLIASMVGCSSSGSETSSKEESSSAASSKTEVSSEDTEVEPLVLEPSSDPNLIYGVPRAEDWTGEVTEIEFMLMSEGWSPKPFGSDPATAEIIKKTGVKFKLIAPQGEGAQVANAMLAAGDYPEVIHMDANYVFNNYVTAGALYAVDELAAEYNHPYLVGTYIPEIVVKARSAEDGHLYIMPNWFSDDGFGATAATMNLRKDVYTAMGEPEIKTMDDLYNYLVQIKETGYTNPDGTAITYPYFQHYGTGASFFGEMVNIYGIVSTGWRYYDEADQEVKFLLRSEEATQAIQWMNKVYNEGLWDPESFTMDSTGKSEALNQGRYAVTMDHTFSLRTANTNITTLWGSDGNDYRWFGIAPPEGNEGVRPYCGTASRSGGSGNMITKNCQNVEAAIRYFDYVYSPQGNITLWYGPEGQTFDFVDGAPVMRQEAYDAKMADWTAGGEVWGIRAFDFSMNQKYNWERTQENEYDAANRALANEYAGDSTLLASMIIDPLSEAGIAWASLSADIPAEVAAIIREPDASKIPTLVDELIARWENQGLTTLEAEWTRQYNMRAA